MDTQIEKAYQKQPIFQNTKTRSSGAVKKAGKEKRWYKDVGLGFKVRRVLAGCDTLGLRMLLTNRHLKKPLMAPTLVCMVYSID